MKDAAFMSIVPKPEDAKTKIVYMGERLKRNKMRMSIDEAISHLGTYSSTMGSGQTTQAQHEESKRVAIDTMRKYQQIAAIMRELNGDFYGSYLKDRQALEKIYAVVEDKVSQG